MSPTLEDAINKLKTNELEAGRQILIGMLNEDPSNEIAWKHLIESYVDLDFQIKLANEYFNLTGGSQKATQMLLKYSRIKNDRYAQAEVDDMVWLSKLSWLGKVKGFEKVRPTKTLLTKTVIGLLVFTLLMLIIWISTGIGTSARSHKLQADYERVKGVYSEQTLEFSTLRAQYGELQTLYSELEKSYTDLQTVHNNLLLDYQALLDAK
jgi:hypothetical protein